MLCLTGILQLFICEWVIETSGRLHSLWSQNRPLAGYTLYDHKTDLWQATLFMTTKQTSGRLHSLWPQNKRLHTPWTTDWMHARQDRWIQTEQAFTLTNNSTKPNLFEIISLQTTRKENNWKTEETLARKVVTLETERIKGSNPWCLWWWWWWWWWGLKSKDNWT
jgi:hypothetical protein